MNVLFSYVSSAFGKLRFTNGTTITRNKSTATTAVDEMGKFDLFDWWSDDSMKALRAMNELRIPLIVNHLPNKKESKSATPLLGCSLLDIGSGGGLVCEPLARLGATVVGVDPNANCVQYANSRLSGCSSDLKSNLKYVNSTVEEFVTEETKGTFDGIVASEVLEHIDDVESVIKSCHQLLKPKGALFITTINQTLPAYLLAIIAAENVLRLVPQGMHEYNKLVPFLSLKVMLEKNNFAMKLSHGMIYNPLTQRWSWTWNTLVNYAVVATKFDSSNSV